MIEELRLRKILVPTDFSATARRALDAARELALSAGPAEIVLAHANFLPREIEALAVSGTDRIIEQIEKTANEQLDKLVAQLWGAGVTARQVHRLGRPDEVILQLAESEQVDLIVMGTHGRRALARLFLGSAATQVLRQAKCPVMTVPAAAETESVSS